MYYAACKLFNSSLLTPFFQLKCSATKCYYGNFNRWHREGRLNCHYVKMYLQFLPLYLLFLIKSSSFKSFILHPRTSIVFLDSKGNWQLQLSLWLIPTAARGRRPGVTLRFSTRVHDLWDPSEWLRLSRPGGQRQGQPVQGKPYWFRHLCKIHYQWRCCK